MLLLYRNLLSADVSTAVLVYCRLWAGFAHIAACVLQVRSINESFGVQYQQHTDVKQLYLSVTANNSLQSRECIFDSCA